MSSVENKASWSVFKMAMDIYTKSNYAVRILY
jgi:hypothetical protein